MADAWQAAVGHPALARLIEDGAFQAGPDGVYSSAVAPSSGQALEREFRERVASTRYADHLQAVAGSHSVPVMDHEVDLFLRKLHPGALVLDVGGCWGWHWRRLAKTRPDIGVVIVDFVRANLAHGIEVLGPLAGKQVVLLHADATSLPFGDGTAERGFDAVWTVQVFQHIPDFERACREASRVLKAGGRFVNYSVQPTPVVRAIYRLMRRQYHVGGIVPGSFFFDRASDAQRDLVAALIGGGRVEAERYTECLFHPDLGLTFTGKPLSLLGRLDSRLSELPCARWLARQRSIEAVKPS